jgi:hypothetical protein
MKKQLATLGLLLSTLGFAGSAQSALINAIVSVTDFDAPTNFSFTFAVPVSLTGPVSWTADVSGLLTDGGSDGISMAPFGSSIYEFLIDGVLLGTDSLGTLTSDYAANYNGFYNCGLGCLFLELRIHFAASGGDDFYSNISGRLEVIESDASVPEPGVAALFCLGLAGIGFMRRFRAGIQGHPL